MREAMEEEEMVAFVEGWERIGGVVTASFVDFSRWRRCSTSRFFFLIAETVPSVSKAAQMAEFGRTSYSGGAEMYRNGELGPCADRLD